MRYIFVIVALVSFPAFAEVSDKMSSITDILLTGTGLFVVAFGVGFIRWWLSVLFVFVGALYTFGCISLWQEIHMRNALLNEQGWYYFGALGLEQFLIYTGAFSGIYIGRKSKT
ncbi:MAG: hypothetical protein ABJJ44_16485 [Paraglaciecola sp.]|uniref:hypothetical protein n=1 Tax=Paraglaciecola sp. TaxID=1920173 RepID=UPI003298B607